MKPIGSVEEFYAHALAIEREAMERYQEFDHYFRGRGEEVLAGLCANLARLEGDHLRELVEASAHLQLPAIDASGYCWIEAHSPEASVREVFYRIATPRHLLEAALQAEIRAFEFFDNVVHTTPEPQVRALASEMAAEEMQHIGWVRNALEYHPYTQQEWQRLFT